MDARHRLCSNLLDMPNPWMQLLIEEMSAESAIAFIGTCRATRDLVFQVRRARAVFGLPFWQHEAPELRAKLHTACKYASHVHLEMHHNPDIDNSIEDCGTLLMFGALSASGRLDGLKAIQSAEINGVQVEGLVPPWLSLSCPKLRSLTLRLALEDSLPAPSVPVAMCSQLKQLRIVGSDSTMQPTAHWQHHLRSLTGLNHLALVGYDPSAAPPLTLEACSAVGAQLTTLDVCSEQWASPEELHHLAAWFPCIRELRLPGTYVMDRDMEALYTLPAMLHRLVCYGFDLEGEYTGRASPYTHLSFTLLDIDQFDRLPWEGVRSVQDKVWVVDGGAQWSSFIKPSADVARCTRVAGAIAKCGGVVWRSPISQVSFGGRPMSCACLAAALPILANTQTKLLALSQAQDVSLEVLKVLAQYLASHQVSKIAFDHCTWAPGALPHLLPSLPASVTSVHMEGTHLTKVQLILMCANACRPVLLRLKPGPAESARAGWTRRVQEAMADSGHQHVQLTFE